MPDKVRFQAIKGVRDILPPESALWNRVEQTAREVFGTYGFAEIRLPILEQRELFDRSIGGETDIVSKEMYGIANPLLIIKNMLVGETKFPGFKRDPSEYLRFLMSLSVFLTVAKDALQSKELGAENERGIHELDVAFQAGLKHFPNPDPSKESERQQLRKEVGELIGRIEVEEQSLRPEATASVVRAYIEHGMQVLPGNVKLYYMGPMFRRERPQKGRYRQFYQIGAEVLGTSDAPGIDAEVIEMLMSFFERLKLKGAVLNINSIGDKNCRPAYVEKLRAELQKVREQLGADSQRRIETNPLRVLDSKLEHEQPIIEKLPRIGENLCADCRAHYAEVKQQLDLRGIQYQENWRLVRGLDYYMRTTFEITAPGLGSQNAVCGGGRYDGLVELLGGPAGPRASASPLAPTG